MYYLQCELVDQIPDKKLFGVGRVYVGSEFEDTVRHDWGKPEWQEPKAVCSHLSRFRSREKGWLEFY